MHGEFYYNRSNSNVVVKQVENITPSITLHFKDESEILNPTIYVSRDYNIKNSNYCYVQELNRYYFINEIILEHQRYVVKCHVDALTSFMDSLYKQSAIVERNATRHNLYLDDSEVLLFNMTRTETFKWDNGFDVTVGGVDTKVASYLLVVNGSGEPEPEPTPTPNNEGGD